MAPSRNDEPPAAKRSRLSVDIQAEIDRLALGAQQESGALRNIIAARDEEVSSLKYVLAAREEELASVKLLVHSPEPASDALQRSAGNVNGEPSEAPLTGATQVFTIVASNYLAFARVLAASLARHNPAARLHVVVLDDPDHLIGPEPSFEIIRPEELPFDPPSDFYTMAAIYDVTELATALKPWAFEHLFARGAAAVIFLDPDIEVFDALGPLEMLTLKHGMLLTPHITEPLPLDGKHPDARDLGLTGIYNLGFLALSAVAASAFLPWWRSRLRRECLNDAANGLFVDQRWMDFAPALFEPCILKDPGYNVAYWNLAHRVLSRESEGIFVNGHRLRFLHYSGFSPRAPHLLSKHQLASPRIRLSEHSILAELCERYAAALEQAGFANSSSKPYAFAATASGLPLDRRARKVLRRTYLDDEADAPATPSFSNPFSAAGARDVVERLLRPSPHAPRIPGYLGEIWNERADLRIAFPHIASVDAKRFLEWVRTRGVREHHIPAELIPYDVLQPRKMIVKVGDDAAPYPSDSRLPDPFDADAMAVESLLGSPRPNLPSRMQRLLTPLRRLILRSIRVYWVQQLAVDRALLAAMRTLRREVRSETGPHATMLQRHGAALERIVDDTDHMRDELKELAAAVHLLRDRTTALSTLPSGQSPARTRGDLHRDSGGRTDEPLDHERQEG